VRTRPLTFRPKEEKPPPSATLTDGLLAWWNFDETAGTTAPDASGHHVEGRIRGSPRWAPSDGPLGGALEFDGAHTFVDCGDAPALDFRDRMSVAVWFKVRTFDRPFQTLALRANDTWRLQRHGEEGTLEFGLTGPQVAKKSSVKTATLTTKGRVDDDQWHHVVGTYDGARLALYLDGEEQGSVEATGPIALSTAPVTIGENSINPGRGFNGWMGDLRLYGRGLSAAEVRTLHRQGAAPATGAR
jgi:hypothetical protein